MPCRPVLLIMLLGCVCTAASTIEVAIENNEVWVIDSDQASQLTHDGRSKPQAVLSLQGDRIAYYEQCPEGEGCTPSVVILDVRGNGLQRVVPTVAVGRNREPCVSILGIAWTHHDRAIAVECHLTPSASSYSEIDLRSGSRLRELFGFGFRSSPDGDRVAYIGPLLHFAPPYAQSYFLEVDRIAIYPLPKGKKPIQHIGFGAIPGVVKREGNRYSGIHEFVSDLVWSPQSDRIAVVDCSFTWTEHGTDPGHNSMGDERDRSCSIAVVSLSGAYVSVPLPRLTEDELSRSRLFWADSERLRLVAPKAEFTLSVPRT